MRDQNLQDSRNLQNRHSDGFGANLALIALFLLLALAPDGAKAQYVPVAWYDFDSNHWENGVGSGLDFIGAVDSMWVGNDDPVRDSFLQVNTLQLPPFSQPADSGRTFTELTVEFWFRADKPFAGLSVARLSGKCHFELYDQYVAWDVVTYPGQHWRLELLLYGAGVTDPHHLWDGQWHHFAGTFDVKTGTQRLYIDGRNESGMTRHHGTASAMGQAFAFIPYQSMVDSVGDLDEIAVYDTVLPPDLIWQHYFYGLQGQAYASVVNPGGPFAPVPQNVAQGGIDTLEFCPGYPSTPVATPDLLKGYPAPRYRPGHAMPRLLPWFNDTYNIANNSGVTPFSAGGPPMDTLLRRLATDYNYYLHLGGAREYLNVGPFSQAQFYIQSGNLPVNAGLPRFVVLNWAQTNPEEYQPAWGAGCYIKRQTLPTHFYARPLVGAPFVNVFGRKLWSWQAAQNPLDTRLDTLDRDGFTARYYLSLVNAVIPHPIAMIGENDEAVGSMPNGWVTLPNGDPWMFQDRSLSFPGLSQEGYQSRRGRDFRRRYSDRFIHYQDSLPWQLDSVQLYWYNVGGDAGISFFQYDSARAINRFADGVPRGTDYWYPQFPARWRYGTNGVTGFRELLPARLAEILAGDRRFMPGVSPGFHEQGSVWISTDRAMLRPGQFLGCLKALGMMGADGYAMYMTHGISTSLVPMEGSWRAWQPAMPAYAQAVTDRMGSLLSGGHLLDGDQAMGPGSLFMFATGNPMDLVCARRADNAARYALHGSIQRLDNAPSHGPKGKAVCFSLADSSGVVIDTLLMDIRAQGSTYILDMSTADTVFYQLDGWHEWMEPWRWCRDFVLEGELADSVGNGPGVIATERPAGHAAGDFREFTSWMRAGNGQALLYRFTTRHVEQDTLHLWMRSRRTQPGANNDVDVFLDGIYRGTVPVAATAWGWSAIPVVLPGLGQRDHDLRLVSNHNGIEIDKVLLARSADPFAGQVFLPEALVEDSVVCLDDSAVFHVGGKVPPGCLEYRWDFGDGNFAYSADPVHLYAFAGVYEVVLEVRHTCLDSVAWDTVTVVVDAPQVEAGRDTFMCAGDTMRLAGAGSYFFKWREDSLVSSPIVPDPLAWPLESGYLHIEGWDPLTGCHAVDSLHITLLGQQPVGDTVIWYCDGQGIVEVEVPQGPGQYWVWWASDSLLDSVDRWDSHVAYVIEDSGHVFTAYVSDFCRCDTDTVAVQILPVGLPVAAIASQDTICEGDTLWLHAQGTVSGQGLPDWTGLFGYNANGGIRTTATGVTVWALPPALGNATVPITLQYIVSGSTCGTLGRVRDTVEVVLLGRPNVQGVPDTLWACPGGLMPQLSPVSGHPAPVAWDWQPAAGFSNPAVPSSTFTGSPGIPVACSLTVNTAWGCPVTYQSVLMPMGILPDSLYQCPGDSVGLGVSAGVQPGMAINVQWSPGTWFADSTSPVTTLGVPGLSPQVVTVQYDYFGCPTMHDTLLVVPHGLPEVLGPDTVRGCAGDTLPLVATLASPVQWGLSGLSVGDSTAPVTWTVAQGQPFTLYVASCDSFFCPGFDSVLVTWLDVIPGPDTVRACLNDTIVLPGIGGGTCSWSPMTDVVSTNNCTLVALPQNDRWYRLAWTDSTGCVAYDSVWVDVDSVSLTGALVSVDDSICLGDSVQLVATGGTVYQWTPSVGLSNAAVGSPWASPLVTTTYIVAISNGGQCRVVDSLVVAVDTTVPPGVLTASDTSICLGETIKLTAQGGTAYLWSGPGIGGMTVNSMNVTPAATSTYTVTVSDGGTCVWVDSVTVLVESCCYVPNAQQFHNASASDVIAYFSCPPGGCTGRPIHVIDTLTIDVTPFTLTNCDIWMDSLAVILVPAGHTFTLSDSRVRAGCGYMWESILVEDSTALCRVVAGSEVRDGLWAMRSVAGGRFLVQNSTFRDNYVGVRVGPKAGLHLGTVTGTHFTSKAAAMLPPHAGRLGECGVWAEGVDSIRVGGGTWGGRNTFDTLGIGIIAERSSLWATNNLFSYMVIQAPVKGSPGYGHYGTGIVGKGMPGIQRPTRSWWLRVGGDSTRTNRFVDIMQGVKVVENCHLNAAYNTFRRVTGIGVRMDGNYHNSLWVRNNRFINCAVGVKGTLNTGSVVQVSENRVRGDAQHPGHGVWLSDLNIFGTNPPNNGSATVADNLLSLWGYGIVVEGLGNANVLRNTDTIRGVHPQTLRAAGVAVYGSDKAKVRDNVVRSFAPLSDSVDGISLVLSNRLSVTCNRLFDCQTGLHTWGSCDASYVRWNEFTGGRKGIMLQDNGIIGQQGLPNLPLGSGEPSGNRWLGGWSCGAVVKMAFTYNTFPGSPMFVRNNAQMKPTGLCNGFDGGGGPITFANTVGLIPNCTPIPPNVAGATTGLMDIAANTRQYPVLVNEGKAVDRQMLLDTLEQDVVLRNSQTQFQAFHANNANGTLGKIRRSQVALATLQPSMAVTQAAYTPSNLIEDNHKAVAGVLDRLQGQGQVLGQQDSLALEQIATQCPLAGGKAVYIARGILHLGDPARIFEDGNCAAPQRFAESTETAGEGINTLILMPNPASDEVRLVSTTTATVWVYDMRGQLVKEVTVMEGEIALDASNWSRGVYLFRYRMDSGEVGSIRLVLQ